MNRKKYNRRKRIIIAYTLRTIVGLVAAGMVFLMLCGCIHICNFFKGKMSETVGNPYQAGTNSDSVQRDMVTMNNLGKKAEYTIVLDAGHGGKDGGTSSGDVVEKDITLEVVLRMKELLEEKGIQIVLTRDSDESISLADRAAVANQSYADLFVSIHCNYFEDDSAIKGLECYYYKGSEEGRRIAESILEKLQQKDNITVRNAKEETFYVLKQTKIPAVLVELGYLSNAKECGLLASEVYQETLAEELAEALEKILSEAFSYV